MDGDVKMRKYTIWLYYLIPIVIHLLFFPLWMIETNGNISLIEILVGTIAIPVYLIILSGRVLKNYNIGFFLILLIMLVVTLVGIAISYFNWGIVTGNLLTPDSETIIITQGEMMISSIIVTAGWGIMLLIKNRSV